MENMISLNGIYTTDLCILVFNKQINILYLYRALSIGTLLIC